MADPLTPAEREMCHTIYPKIIAAFNEQKAPTHVAFSVLGAVLSQVVEREDAETQHKLVDAFAESAHKILDREILKKKTG